MGNIYNVIEEEIANHVNLTSVKEPTKISVVNKKKNNTDTDIDEDYPLQDDATTSLLPSYGDRLNSIS